MKRFCWLIFLIAAFVLYRFLPKGAYIALILAGCVLIFGYVMIQKKRFIEANKCCPYCGKDMCIQRRSHRKKDAKGYERVGGMWVKSSNVIEYKRVLYCADCAYELNI